jgi:hypothetical protein
MKQHSVEVLAAVGFGILLAIFLSEGITYPGRSAYMPTATALVGLVMCGLWALRSARLLYAGNTDRLNVRGIEVGHFVLIIGAGALYTALFSWIGFFSATIIMIPGIAVALGFRDWKTLFISVLGFVAVLYVVFRLLLSVPLPDETILKLIGG